MRRLSFFPGAFHARFVIHEVAVQYVSLSALQLSPVTVFVPVKHTNILLEQANGQSLGTFKQQF